jgi:hypothetical protein
MYGLSRIWALCCFVGGAAFTGFLIQAMGDVGGGIGCAISVAVWLVGIFVFTYQSPYAKCPYCAETIKKDALICKHCGRSQLLKPPS